MPGFQIPVQWFSSGHALLALDITRLLRVKKECLANIKFKIGHQLSVTSPPTPTPADKLYCMSSLYILTEMQPKGLPIPRFFCF